MSFCNLPLAFCFKYSISPCSRQLQKKNNELYTYLNSHGRYTRYVLNGVYSKALYPTFAMACRALLFSFIRLAEDVSIIKSWKYEVVISFSEYVWVVGTLIYEAFQVSGLFCLSLTPKMSTFNRQFQKGYPHAPKIFAKGPSHGRRRHLQNLYPNQSMPLAI